MRALCVVFVLLSLVIAFGLQNTPIVTLMSFSWGTLAGAFLAPFGHGLFWKKTTRLMWPAWCSARSPGARSDGRPRAGYGLWRRAGDGGIRRYGARRQPPYTGPHVKIWKR